MTETPVFISKFSREPRLANCVAVITGASRGFGQAIALRFAEEHAVVILLDIHPCDETIQLIKAIDGEPPAAGERAAFFHCDISSEAAVLDVAAKVRSQFGPVHILVNNAASFRFAPVTAATEDDWDVSLRVNIKGHAFVTKAFAPFLKEAAPSRRGGSAIVWQGSISSFLAQPNCATYAVGKAAIVQLMRSAAFDMADDNIRSNALCAGTVETPISAAERAAHGWSVEEWAAQKTKDVMLRRVGTTREVADAALFLASSEASYITGTSLMVDGGQSACTVMP